MEKKTNLDKLKIFYDTFLDNSYRIETDSYLSKDVIQFLFDIKNKIAINKLFVIYPKTNNKQAKYSYFADVICSNCNKHFEHYDFNKHSLLDYITTEKFICEDCKEQFVEQERIIRNKQYKIALEEGKKHKIQNTRCFIDNYLNPESDWIKEIKTSDKFRILYKQNVYWDEVKSYIKNMSYGDFINTPYWKAISDRAKQNAGWKCELCGNKGVLNTHHKTYEHHGQELFYMKDDLIVLCDNCHKKFHDII